MIFLRAGKRIAFPFTLRVETQLSRAETVNALCVFSQLSCAELEKAGMAHPFQGEPDSWLPPTPQLIANVLHYVLFNYGVRALQTRSLSRDALLIRQQIDAWASSALHSK